MAECRSLALWKYSSSASPLTNTQTITIFLPEPAPQTAVFFLAPAAASEPPPAGESPSLQTTRHAERRLDSRSDPTASVCLRQHVLFTENQAGLLVCIC